MRSNSRVGIVVSLVIVLSVALAARAADPPARKPLDARQREAVLSLIKAVDLAQDVDAPSDETLSWDAHFLKSSDQTVYVPFRITLNGTADVFKSSALYVRVVSRRDGVRASEEHSFLREWVLHGGIAAPRRGEQVFIGPGEMPVGGPATSSSRRATAAPAEALAVLALQERDFETQKAAAAAEKKRLETKERDPFRFAFEDYYFVDVKPARADEARVVARALTLPPGEYDVFAALVDRAHANTSSPAIVKRTITVPDFWADRLVVSGLILAKAVTPLKAPLPPAQQIDHPYTLGQTEIVPVASPAFTTDDALTVVFQMTNYGAPDADLKVDYTFYRTDGTRRLFNRTEPQQLSDADLPPPQPWDTRAFAMQSMRLAPFPPGPYELEVTVTDRVTRATARSTVAFTVASGVR
jgi:hypothetical protein